MTISDECTPSSYRSWQRGRPARRGFAADGVPRPASTASTCAQQPLEETKRQRDNIDQLLLGYGLDKHEYEDGSMRAILREAERWAKMVSDPDARDAGIIASAQRVEHYEIAVYGTLATWARQLGHREDERVLHSILAERRELMKSSVGWQN